MKQQEQDATLDDYRHFHGMLCHPKTAKRCIQSFRGGTVLFLPHDYMRKTPLSFSLSEYDCSGRVLNWMTYYSLVFVSLTGLWTLLGRTKLLIARHEGNTPIINKSSNVIVPLQSEVYPNDLVVSKEVLDYIVAHHPGTTGLFLERRFEFNFRGLLKVVMLHIQCSQGKRHLVEVYRLENKILHALFGCVVFPTLGWLSRSIFSQRKAV
jgi:hypothetical protein